MLWKSGRESENVEDRRGISMGGMPVKLSGGMIAAVVVISLLLGQNPLEILAMLAGSGSPVVSTQNAPAKPNLKGDETAQFVSVVLGSTEDIWTKILPRAGASYRAPKLVLFSDQVSSACGFTTSATGPFYCPGDRKVYLDLSFFRELDRLGAPGDFAQAYVVGHEVGHHIQNLLGISNQVRALQQRGTQAQANALSVALELQADCFAGVWGYYADKQGHMLEPGDADEGLAAASAIGDDKLSHRTGRSISPESFTHGSSEQRRYWLHKGLVSGNIAACDTFSAAAKISRSSG
jgi:predicted metalloprotease